MNTNNIRVSICGRIRIRIFVIRIIFEYYSNTKLFAHLWPDLILSVTWLWLGDRDSADPTLFHLWAKRFKFFVTGLIEVIYSWYKIVLGKTFPRYGRIQSWLAAIVLFYFFPQLPCLDWMDWHQVIMNRYERSPCCSFLCNFVGNSELKKVVFSFQEKFHKWNVISMFSAGFDEY